MHQLCRFLTGLMAEVPASARFLLYLASLRPLSLTGAHHLDAGKLLSVSGTRAMGHVLSSPTRIPERLQQPRESDVRR